MTKILTNLLSSITNSDTLKKILIFSLIAITLIGLSTAIICIYISKPIGDDFGAITYYQPSLWLSNTWHSLMTTGRYGQSIFGAIAYGLFRNKISNILPMIIIFWFITLAYMYLKTFLSKTMKIKSSPIALTIALMITFLTLFVNTSAQYNDPSTWISYQTFFWPSGIVTYTAPLLLLITAVYGLFVRKNNLTIRKRYIIFAVTIFLTGLFNEIQPATIMAISFVLILLSFIKPVANIVKQQPIYIIAIASSLLSLLTLFFSHGRQSIQASTIGGDKVRDIVAALHNFIYSINHLIFRPQELFLIAAVGLAIALTINSNISKDNRKNLKRISYYGILLGGFILIATLESLLCSFLLVAIGYGEKAGIISRTILLPQILYVSGLVILTSSLFGIIISKLESYAVAIIIAITIIALAILTPGYMDKIVSQLNTSLNYSNAWNNQEASIKAQLAIDKNSTIYLPLSVSGIGVDETMSCVGPTWLNHQLEDYFHIKRVCSVLDPH
jgi:hypothetical protein